MAARILLTVRTLPPTSICPVCLIAFGPGVVMPIEFCLIDCLLSCLILYIFIIPNQKWIDGVENLPHGENLTPALYVCLIAFGAGVVMNFICLIVSVLFRFCTLLFFLMKIGQMIPEFPNPLLAVTLCANIALGL